MEALTELQYTIVGTLMQEPEKVGETLTRLSVADFPDIPTRGIYAAIGDLHFSGAPIDAITVLDRAGDEYGDAILYARQQYTTDLDYCVGQLLEKSRMLTVQKLAGQIETADSLEAVERLVGKLNASMSSRKNVRTICADEAATDFWDRYNSEKRDYYHWGFEKLDKSLHVVPGNFVIIGGYASDGKTALSLQFAKTISESRKVGYFSYETSREDLVDRLTSHMGQVPLQSIQSKTLSDLQIQSAARATEKLYGMMKNLMFIEAAGMSVRDIQAFTLSNRFDAIFIDYLQLIKGKDGPRYEVVTDISIALHTMAQEHKVTVIALSQLTRPDQEKGGAQKAPNMHSFRESGQIEQDADVALLLYAKNPNDYRSRRILKCGKNRNGERFSMELDFDGRIQTFSVPQPPQADDSTPDWVRACDQEDGPSFFKGGK